MSKNKTFGDYVKDTARGTGQAIGSALQGIADFVGLGETLRDAIHPNKKKKIKTEANKLKDEVAQALEREQAKVDDLMSLSSYNMGDQKSITARNVIAKSKKKLKDKLNSARVKLETIRSIGDQAINAAENAKNFKLFGAGKAMDEIKSAKNDFNNALKNDISVGKQ